MALPDDAVETVRRLCVARSPEHLREQVRVDVDVADRFLTIVEVRPPWDGVGEHTREPVARLRYAASRGEWTLYWRGTDLRFHGTTTCARRGPCSPCCVLYDNGSVSYSTQRGDHEHQRGARQLAGRG